MNSLIPCAFCLLWDNLTLHFPCGKSPAQSYFRSSSPLRQREMGGKNPTAPVTIQLLEQPCYCSSHHPVYQWKGSRKTHSTQTTYAGLSFTTEEYFLIKPYYNFYYLRSEFLSRSLSFFVKFLYNWTSLIHFQDFRIKTEVTCTEKSLFAESESFYYLVKYLKILSKNNSYI